MNGRSLLILVLILVFAVPLVSAHILVNPVDQILTTSTINSQEVPFSDQELFDNNVPVLNVGLRKENLYNMASAKADFITGNGTDNVDRSRQTGFNNSKRGGNLRIASKH